MTAGYYVIDLPLIAAGGKPYGYKDILVFHVRVFGGQLNILVIAVGADLFTSGIEDPLSDYALLCVLPRFI